MEVRQLALEELRKRMAHWPVKDNGWAESDIQNAIDVQEQRFANSNVCVCVCINYLFLCFCVHTGTKTNSTRQESRLGKI